MVTLALLLVLLADSWSQISVTYTSGNTFVVPAGVTEITVECWGAGGRGGQRTSGNPGGGGGGGAYSRSVLQGVSGSYTISVGAGSSNTSPGGDSWFGSAATVMAKGGESGGNSTTGATGGQAAQSVGDITRNGGNGFTTANANGGGGGSSAGPGAAGVTATSATGATAPAGGGNGGAGRSNSNGAGTAGSDPGGGGGGARGNGQTGGAGGDGQVVVSFFVEGTCMGAATSNAIPDAGCFNNIRIPVSGLGAALGTGAGQVRLTSVELIVNHGRNQDLDISLTSPGGTTRNLITDNFNNGTNLGNPASCPGSPLVIQDGATALPTGTVNNAVGPYAPDATLAGFTGTPNGNWVLSICDDAAGGTTGNLRYVKLNFCTVPTTPVITSNSPVCAGTSLSLSATSTGATAYAWTGTGTYSPNNASAAVTVSGAASGNYAVTASNTCGSANASVAVVVNPAPTSVTANSSSTSVCSTANTVNLTSAGLATGVVVLSEDFNAGTNSWTRTNTSTGGTPANAAFTLRANNYNWNGTANVTFSSNDATQFYLSNSDAQGSGNTATALTSPVFSTAGMTAATINFHHVFRQQNNGNDRGYVEASTNGSSWTTLQTYTTTQGTSGAFVAGSATLSAGFLDQATVYIRFRYTSPYGWYWGIDNVSVSGTGLPDFAWTSTPSGFTSSLQNPTGVAVTQNTVYTVTATGPNGCSTTASTATVNFTQAPTATISYAASPYCSNSGTVSVTHTGTPGGTYTSTGGLSLNASTGAVNTATSTPGTYTVTYTIAAAAPCAQFQTTASITITANPSATIAYTFSTYCQTASTINVNRTGTSGGTYTASPAGLSINASTGAVDLALSTTQPYTVTYTLAAAGGCAQVQTTASLTITAPQLRYHDTDGDGFGDPNDFVSSCTPLIGYVSNNTDNCPTFSGKQGDACNDGNTNTTNDIITGACVCAGTNSAWYSQGTGTFADPIWSQNINGPGAAATIGAGSIVVVKTGHTVSLAGAQAVQDITVQSGATLSLGTHALTAHGSAVQVDGTLSGGTGALVLVAPTATLSGAGTLDLNDLTINASTGVTCSANANIRGTLLLSNGVFTASGTVQLVSNANGTGRLGPVAPTASYSGNLKVNRFIPAGKTNWRLMGSPVAGQTVNEWKDDFTTAGFPGSHAPTFSNPLGSGNLWPSVRWYNEANTGATVNDGLMGATNISQSLAQGQGFAAWSGNGLVNTTAFTVDMTGAPHVAGSPIALPMSYTNTGVATTDGWNMVCNPLASPILFSNISRGANVADYITYFDPATGNNATYDISLGAGTNGGTDVIQSTQAFWLKANGPAVTTTVSESAKVSGNGGGFFGGSQIQTTDMVRLHITSAINQFSDETVVLFNNGEPGADGNDVPKFIFAHPDAPQIATHGDGGEMIAINAYGPYGTDISIPVTIDVAISGEYTITATGLAQSGLTCLRLEDLATSTITPLVEGATYSFTALNTDLVSEARFVLHASAPLQLTATDATCNGRDDGAASVDLTSSATVVWSDANGAALLEQNNVSGPTAIQALVAGEYTVSITSNEGCGALTTRFTVEEPSAMEATAVTEPTSCPATEDGTIVVEVLGGVGPYTYAWSNSATGEQLEVAAGTYSVVISDANGCTLAPQEYVVGAGEGPVAEISLESGTVSVDEDVLFVGATSDEVSHTWDFGDGTTSTDLEPTHSYSTPGTYTVTLTVDDGNCTSTTTLDIFVEASTGLPTIVGGTLNAYTSGDFIVVDHNFAGDQPVVIRVFSTGGQLAQEHRVTSAPARIILPAAELATGIWLVRVSHGNNARTFSLPVVH